MPTNSFFAVYERALDAAGYEVPEIYDLAFQGHAMHSDPERGGTTTDCGGFIAGFMCAAHLFCDEDHGDHAERPVPTAPSEGALT